MAYTYADISGSTILNFLNLTNIGRYDEGEIDTDKTQKGEEGSVIGLAVLDYALIATQAEVNTGDFSTGQTANYNASLVYYIAAKLKELSNGEDFKACTEDDFKQCRTWLDLACDHLRKASVAMHENAAFCEGDQKGVLPKSLYTTSLFDTKCGKWEE